MANLTEGYQILRPVAACLTAFNMVDFQNWVLRLAFAVLTGVAVPVKHVLPDVPKPFLLAVLVADSGNFRILDLLDVEGPNLDDRPGDWQDFFDFAN